METVNTQGTSGVSLTVGLPFAEAKHDLLVLRNRRGANSPIGHACSNLSELLPGIPEGTRDWECHPSQTWAGEIAKQSADLAKAMSGDLQ